MHRILAMAGVVLAAWAVRADDVKPAPSKIVSVTVYQATALVVREVTTPEAAGAVEVVVSPMPPATMQSSLYAEGGEGVRIVSSRYRTRAIAEDTRDEVRKIDAKLRELARKIPLLQAELKLGEQNAAFLTKLEDFTGATMKTLTDKGLLDSEKTIALANFIRENRGKTVREDVATKQQLEDLQAEIAFQQRLRAEKAQGEIRTERDAVIVVEKAKAGPGTLRLSYLVNSANWKPQYRLRTVGKEGEKVQIEYQAAVVQQTGEDWANVNLTLSTAQPLLNASPPDLRALEVAVGGASGQQLQGGRGGNSPNAPEGGAAGPGGMPSSSGYIRDLERQSKELKGRAAQNALDRRPEAAGKDSNDAAALDQFRDLLLSKDEMTRINAAGVTIPEDGPSVAFPLKARTSVPSRPDEQVLEIAKLDLAPKFYYKATPVLTSHVYRVAELTNTSEYILLPGEATMYLAGDFVGQAKLPLIAAGKPFSVGFGVDPQLQVVRKLIDKTRTTQGGNQVLNFKYKILLSSYKSTPVDVQVWDRMPHAEAVGTIGTSFTMGATKLSEDPLYVRDEKHKNLLRWDVKVEPKQNGEKALTIDYEFKMELDKNVTIGSFLSK